MTSERIVRWALVGLGDIVRKRVGAALVAQPQSALRACVTRDATVREAELASWTTVPPHPNDKQDDWWYSELTKEFGLDQVPEGAFFELEIRHVLRARKSCKVIWDTLPGGIPIPKTLESLSELSVHHCVA